VSTYSLPRPFEDLEPLVAAGWSLSTERERNGKRYESTMADLRAFYDAILPRVDDIFTYLDEVSLERMPDDAARLFHLALMLAEISCAVERHGQPQTPNGFDTDRFPPFAPIGELP